MPITMNENSKQEELKKLLKEHETYLSTTWASIQTNTPKLLTYSLTEKKPNIGFQNIYCYVGLTSTAIHIVTLHAMDVTKVTGTFSIPLQDIQEITIHNGLLKSSALLDFGKEKIKLLWINEALGMDIKNQRKQVKTFCELLQKHSKISS